MSKFDAKKRCPSWFERNLFWVTGGLQIKKTPPEVTYLNRKKTKEKHFVDKEQHRKANTPWAPSGPKRIIIYSSMCLRHDPASGRLEGRILSARVSAVVGWCFCRFGCRKEGGWWNKSKFEPKVPKVTNMEPKGCHNELKVLQNQFLERSNFQICYVDLFVKIAKTVTAHL